MNYIKSLTRVQECLGVGIRSIYGADGSLVVPIDAILKFLKEYEIGTPEEFYDGTYYGANEWFKTEIDKGNIEFSYSDNTYDCNGQVLYDFGFSEYESLEDESVLVMMVFHFGNPFFRNMTGKEFEPIIFKFESGISFYDVLEQISLESSLIPYVEVKINNLDYGVIPRIFHDSYFVFCKNTGEELDEFDSDISEIVKVINYKQFEEKSRKRMRNSKINIR